MRSCTPLALHHEEDSNGRFQTWNLATLLGSRQDIWTASESTKQQVRSTRGRRVSWISLKWNESRSDCNRGFSSMQGQQPEARTCGSSTSQNVRDHPPAPSWTNRRGNCPLHLAMTGYGKCRLDCAGREDSLASDSENCTYWTLAELEASTPALHCTSLLSPVQNLSQVELCLAHNLRMQPWGNDNASVITS